MRSFSVFSKKNHRRYQSQIKKIKPVVLVVLLVAGLSVAHNLFFKISHVSCRETGGGSCSSVVVNILNRYKGKSLLLINRKQIKQLLHEVSPGSQVKIKLKLPGKLIVELNSNQPLAVVAYLSYTQPTLLPNKIPIIELDNFVSSLSAESYNLLSNGEMVPGNGSANINLLFSRKPNQKKLKDVFRLIVKIGKILPLEKTYLLNNNLYLKVMDMPNIIISLESSPEKISRSLQAIPSIAKIKEGISVIDLRFNHPIIQ